MRLKIDEDQLSETSVAGDEGSPLSVGNPENFLIRETGRVVSGNLGELVAPLMQIGENSRINILVEEELHALPGSVAAWRRECR